VYRIFFIKISTPAKDRIVFNGFNKKSKVSGTAGFSVSTVTCKELCSILKRLLNYNIQHILLNKEKSAEECDAKEDKIAAIRRAQNYFKPISTDITNHRFVESPD
jgi:hypothetical protein